jgi:hypothetical protein
MQMQHMSVKRKGKDAELGETGGECKHMQYYSQKTKRGGASFD